jgi:hypothetical protein
MVRAEQQLKGVSIQLLPDVPHILIETVLSLAGKSSAPLNLHFSPGK